jgi:hypothetical protein
MKQFAKINLAAVFNIAVIALLFGYSPGSFHKTGMEDGSIQSFTASKSVVEIPDNLNNYLYSNVASVGTITLQQKMINEQTAAYLKVSYRKYVISRQLLKMLNSGITIATPK